MVEENEEKANLTLVGISVKKQGMESGREEVEVRKTGSRGIN
jgi:hypothetical protein